MSSTEADALARAIFRQVIEPARQERIFPRAPDPSAKSYFTAPPRPSMKPEDFDCPALQSIEAFAEALGALWRSEGHTSLDALPPRLVALCQALAQEMGAEGADVSPFVYAMF
jgi:hypothetical protein